LKAPVMERRGPATFGRAEEVARSDGWPLCNGIPPLDDDGRGHPCGARIYRSCPSIETGTWRPIRKNYAANGRSRLTYLNPRVTSRKTTNQKTRFFWRSDKPEGEWEMMDRPRVGSPTWTEADDQRLRSLALSGMTSRDIAREIGRSVDAVQARAKKLGLSLKQVIGRRRR
jgi:hypothetical protein